MDLLNTFQHCDGGRGHSVRLLGKVFDYLVHQLNKDSFFCYVLESVRLDQAQFCLPLLSAQVLQHGSSHVPVRASQAYGVTYPLHASYLGSSDMLLCKGF